MSPITLSSITGEGQSIGWLVGTSAYSIKGNSYLDDTYENTPESTEHFQKSIEDYEMCIKAWGEGEGQ